MTIENSVSYFFWSTFADSINVFDHHLSSVVLVLEKITFKLFHQKCVLYKSGYSVSKINVIQHMLVQCKQSHTFQALEGGSHYTIPL